VYIIKLAGYKEKYNVIIFTSEAIEVKRNTILFRDRVSIVKITDKTRLRFYRNCKSFYISLYRKESKCKNYRKVEYRAYNREIKCATCLSGYKSLDLKCLLRLRRIGD
jgi:hypothetical protein